MYSTERGIRNPNAPAAGTTAGTAAGTAGGQGLTHGQSPASGPAPTTAGPHRHDILNNLDPRVDSDMDGRGAMGVRGGGGVGGVGAGQTAAATGAGGVPEGTYGPHRSRAANALDPRVDSDLDGRGAGAGGVGATTTGAGVPTAAGAGTTGSAATTAGAGTAGVGGAGPHRSNLANRLDPRVDSTTGTWKAGSGPAASTGAGTRGI